MSAGQPPTVAQRVIAALREHGPKNDDQLAALIGADRHHVNQVARALEKGEMLKRSVGPRGKLINVLVRDAGAGAKAEPPAKTQPTQLMAEDTVKRALYAYLEARGCIGRVAWAHAPGIDIDVTGPDGRLIIEAKGEAASNPQQLNYFLGALGELVQRMSDESARYGLAFPDNRQYRRLASRLPTPVWPRLRLVVYLVAADGKVTTLAGPGVQGE